MFFNIGSRKHGKTDEYGKTKEEECTIVRKGFGSKQGGLSATIEEGPKHARGLVQMSRMCLVCPTNISSTSEALFVEKNCQMKTHILKC